MVAAETLDRVLEIRQNENKAKNVIMFLGDGMGLSTITASRIYKGQKEGKPGEETILNFEDFPHACLVKVSLMQCLPSWNLFWTGANNEISSTADL